MKRIIVRAVIAAACASLLCVSGCSGSQQSQSQEQQKETVEMVESDTDNPDNITFGKATSEKDYSGKSHIVINIEWTNNGDDAAEFFTAYNMTAYQDGEEIDRTFADGDDWYDDQKSIKPGKTQSFKAMFDSSGKKDVEVEIKNFVSGDVIASKTFELK